MRFGPTPTKWLKCLHLLAVSGWIGGAVSLMMLHFLRFQSPDPGTLHGIDLASHLVDTGVVVWLGATGCLITGLLYSTFTNWGFFRHKWVLVKWIITLLCVLSGTFYLGPWETTMLTISEQPGGATISDAAYHTAMYLNFWFGIVQIILLIFAAVISVFKPWRTAKKEAGASLP